MKATSTPISDRVLWLGVGDAAMRARVTLYSYGNSFELYTELGGQVPTRFIGELGACINRGQHFVDSLLARGWVLDMQAGYQAVPGDTIAIG